MHWRTVTVTHPGLSGATHTLQVAKRRVLCTSHPILASLGGSCVGPGAVELPNAPVLQFAVLVSPSTGTEADKGKRDCNTPIRDKRPQGSNQPAQTHAHGYLTCLPPPPPPHPQQMPPLKRGEGGRLGLTHPPLRPIQAGVHCMAGNNAMFNCLTNCHPQLIEPFISYPIHGVAPVKYPIQNDGTLTCSLHCSCTTFAAFPYNIPSFPRVQGPEVSLCSTAPFSYCRNLNGGCCPTAMFVGLGFCLNFRSQEWKGSTVKTDMRN